jgi:hypothetical protein
LNRLPVVWRETVNFSLPGAHPATVGTQVECESYLFGTLVLETWQPSVYFSLMQFVTVSGARHFLAFVARS